MHNFKVGDYARSVDSGWLGRIESLREERVQIDDTRSYVAVMATMTGVDELCTLAAGLSREAALAGNDTQYHSVADLVPA